MASTTELRGPFLHASLLKCDPQQHLLVLTFHHLQGNGPSYWLFLDELIALYREKAHGQKAVLPEPLPLPVACCCCRLFSGPLPGWCSSPNRLRRAPTLAFWPPWWEPLPRKRPGPRSSALA